MQSRNGAARRKATRQRIIIARTYEELDKAAPALVVVVLVVVVIVVTVVLVVLGWAAVAEALAVVMGYTKHRPNIVGPI